MLTSVEERLKTLVAFPSTTDNQVQVAALLDEVEEQLRPTPLFVHRHESNGVHSLVATSRDTKKPKVWLVAHVDVVGATDDMFQMQVFDDKLVGRGVVDDKFAAAAFIEAAVQLGNSVSDYDFGIMLTGDEETSGVDGVRYLLDEAGYHGEAAFLPDGGLNWEIELQAKGGVRYLLQAEGVSAHGSRPWLGENAIEKLLSAIEEIRNELKIAPLEEAEAEYDTRTFNLGLIKGGEAANQVPAHAEAQIDLRFTGDSDLEEVRSVIQNAVDSRKGVTATEITNLAPINNDENNEWIQKFADILQSEDITPSFTKSYGGTDARFFVEKGTSVIVSQPNGGGLHAEDEWIERKGLAQLVEVTKKLIEQS